MIYEISLFSGCTVIGVDPTNLDNDKKEIDNFELSELGNIIIFRAVR